MALNEIDIVKEYRKFNYYARQLIQIKRKTIESIEILENSEIYAIEDSPYISDLDVNNFDLDKLDRLLLLPTCIIFTGSGACEKQALTALLLKSESALIPIDKYVSSNNNKQIRIFHSEDVVFTTECQDLEKDNIDERDAAEKSSNIKNNKTCTNCDTLNIGMNHKLLEDGLEIIITPTDLDNEKYKNYSHTLYKNMFEKFHPIIIFAISKDVITEQGISELEYLKTHYPDVPILFVQTPLHVNTISENELPESEQQPLDMLWNMGHSGDTIAKHSYLDITNQSDVNVKKASTRHNSCHTLSEDLLNTLCDKLGYLQLDPIPSTLSERYIDGELKLYSDYIQSNQSFYKIKQYFRSHFFERLVRASSMLHKSHAKYMRMFILFAFDMARDIQITPKRIIYAKEKENELYQNLIDIVSEKQDEIKDIIVVSVKELKEKLPHIISQHNFKEYESTSDLSYLTSRDIRLCSCEINDLIMTALNDLVGRHLVVRLNVMRESYFGTLQRCLENLEKDCRACGENLDTCDALKQMMNTAYHVELNISYSFIRSCLEKMKQLVTAMKPTSAIDSDWKYKIANTMLTSLSESKLTKDICHQFKDRLKSSHDSFVACMKKLENQLVGQLEEKEEHQQRLKKMDAPKLARLFLESTSLTDRILNGMPQLEREIGRGQYGVVFGCRSWGNHNSCAIKSLVPLDEKHWNDLAMEFYYTKSLPAHSRIVTLKGSVIDYTYAQGVTPAVLLIMERLTRDLHSGLKIGLDWKCRLQISLDVVQGIRFLHSQGLVHRDVKLKNVLLDNDSRAKLTDLGFCKPEAMMSGSIVGTPIHMAPELLTGHYDNSVDVYAFGILFWYICSGQTKLPVMFEQCSSKDQLWCCVRRGSRPERLAIFNDECWELMSSCWASLPCDRPFLGTVEPLLQHVIEEARSGNTSNEQQVVETTTEEDYDHLLDLSL